MKAADLMRSLKCVPADTLVHIFTIHGGEQSAQIISYVDGVMMIADSDEGTPLRATVMHDETGEAE